MGIAFSLPPRAARSCSKTGEYSTGVSRSTQTSMDSTRSVSPKEIHSVGKPSHITRSDVTTGIKSNQPTGSELCPALGNGLGIPISSPTIFHASSAATPSQDLTVRQNAAYERGRRDGMELATGEARARGSGDLWLMGGTCICVLCTIGLIFLRKAQLTLRQMEHMRQDSTTLLHLKEKELSTEQAQIQHLQGMHREYLARCQKQVAVISRLRKRQHALARMLRNREVSETLQQKKHKHAITSFYEEKIGIADASFKERFAEYQVKEALNMLAGALMCLSMWISFQLGLACG